MSNRLKIYAKFKRESLKSNYNLVWQTSLNNFPNFVICLDMKIYETIKKILFCIFFFFKLHFPLHHLAFTEIYSITLSFDEIKKKEENIQIDFFFCKNHKSQCHKELITIIEISFWYRHDIAISMYIDNFKLS